MTGDNKHILQLPLKIGIAGAAETGSCGIDALDQAKELGRILAEHQCILTTDATTGFPLWAAMGAKENNGMVVGFSPAATEAEHIETYNLPTDHLDMIVYTGFGYAGSNLLLTRSSDAIIFGCGRAGTIHEFMIAFEERKPIGVLEGAWETDELLKEILEKSNKPHDTVIFDTDPRRLVERLIKQAKEERLKHYHV